MEAVDKMHPCQPGGTVLSVKHIAAPEHPEQLPKTLEEREKFLLDVLPEYHRHEMKGGFDYGTNYHGRTHATRAFVMANVMGNILKEKGIEVDMNALSMGIAGHDVGRSHNGTDHEEERSAQMTQQSIEAHYPGAGGAQWLSGVRSAIAHGGEPPTENTIEAYLLNCADSLDYERVAPIDEKHFPFLQIPLETPEGYQPADTNLRKQLIAEAKLLTVLTDPRSKYATYVDDLTRQMTAPGLSEDAVMEISDKKEAVVRELGREEIEQAENLSDQDILNLVKDAIASHPESFPLFSKYYR